VNRVALVILVALAFASGMGSGFVLGRNRAPRLTDIPKRHDVLAALAEEVGATPEQARRLVEVSDRNHERVAHVRSNVCGELAAIRSDVRAQMRAVLETDEQKRRYDAFCARRDAQREEAEK
jgi:hypothetical protein